MNERIVIGILIGFVLIAGIVGASIKMDKYNKIKELKEIDCNKKYDEEKCKDNKKIKTEGSGLASDVLQNDEGKEVIKVYVE